jgi:ATPase subunit of ABC transporter with duplicated ATPase domains
MLDEQKASQQVIEELEKTIQDYSDRRKAKSPDKNTPEGLKAAISLEKNYKDANNELKKRKADFTKKSSRYELAKSNLDWCDRVDATFKGIAQGQLQFELFLELSGHIDYPNRVVIARSGGDGKVE